jgi:uncharacterized protein
MRGLRPLIGRGQIASCFVGIFAGSAMICKTRVLVIGFGLGTAALTVSVPAAAQLSGSGSAFTERSGVELVQFRDFFQFPFGGNRGQGSGQGNLLNPSPNNQQRVPQAYEPTKPPPPRKVETPPTSTVIVIGDTFADWLGYGLEEAFTDTPEIGIVRKIRPYSGLVRYEAARGEVQDWSQTIKDLLAPENPAAVVVMLGLNDRIALRDRPPPAKTSSQGPDAKASASGQTPSDAAKHESEQPAATAPERKVPGGIYEYHSDKWAELYGKRVDEMIAALKSKGVPVLWVGLPAIRGARSTSDMSYLDELYRAGAEKSGITYVDVWDGFVDDKGNFAAQGPDFEGQTRRLRTFDGVNFTKAGAEKLAHYVEHELRRVMTSHVMPVALPGPEDQPKGNVRPEIGPVVPLTATGGGEGGDLLGASSHPAEREIDPVATKVLNHGEALAAPPGRADDFSWPRTNANATTTPDVMPSAPADVSPPPAAKPAAKNDAGKNEPNKNDGKKPANARTQAAPNVAPPPARPSQPRAALDGAPPRPPLPLGQSRD